MFIKQIYGEELEKAKPNTSEDFFNRSTVVYTDKGEDREFHVLYVRYFDEVFSTFTPFESNPIFTVGSRNITFKDIVALVYLLENPGFKKNKRVYCNDQAQFEQYFKNLNVDQLQEIIQRVEQNGFELTNQ
ncbi:hypothetical protein [Desertibacillus haloalkaliphilus]|uniref:hypothetical protein n=1 Tax=Desertibacillus haloalkaliphilus TaxID=1328930 RepID=UPI001C26011F|nr:hypothetical protein [Desertibacillus haloalkaliphilus]MBU8907884.1 hypothetical protein [Desertibacillus haloalkaliphilus]